MHPKIKLGALIALALWLFSSSTGWAGGWLIFFKTTAGDGQVLLEWKTASETNNLGFHIERSLDSVTFQRITEDIIPGAGNSETENSYAYVDSAVTNGITYYYNLITVDMDGVEELANASPVAATPSAQVPEVPKFFFLHQNYPNPFNTATEIRYIIPVDVLVSVKVYNALGAEMATLVDGQQAANQEGDFYTIRWDAADLASGVYFCSLNAGNVNECIKMVLIK